MTAEVAAVLAQAGVALAVAVAAEAAAASVAVVPDETVAAEMIDDVCSLYPCTGTGATALI